MVTRRRVLTAVGASAVAAVSVAPLAFAGCSGRAPGRRSGAPLDRVTYVTALGSFGREGYAWVADAKGFFRDAGLSVRIVPGAAGDFNLQLLAAGKADFAAIDFTGAEVRGGRGTFTNFRAVAGLHQQTMMAILAPAGRGITRPGDLAGKRIGVQAGSVLQTVFRGYARLAGLDARTVRWQPVASPNLLNPLLAAGKVDAVAVFAPGAPGVQAALGGHAVTVLPYSDYLTSLYGNALVTTYGTVQNRPDVVRRFSGALLKGLRWAVDNPDEAGQFLHRAVPSTPASVAAAELRLVAPYVGQPLGGISAARVAQNEAILQAVGLIPAGYDPAQVVAFPMLPSPAASAVGA